MKEMKPFEYLEHTADVKFRAYGRTPEEMLENAALALFQSMVDLSSVRSERTWVVDLDATDLDQLAYRWLSELIFLFETESSVFSRFRVSLQRNEEWRLKGEVGGEGIDLGRHAFETEVKAITLHEFQVRRNELWCVQAVLDV